MRDEEQRAEVIFSDDVVDFMIREVESERVLNQIEKQREMLSLFPEMGCVYTPYYEAAYPPFPCRWVAVPDTPFNLYYHFDVANDVVVIFYMEHQRMNPQGRF